MSLFLHRAGIMGVRRNRFPLLKGTATSDDAGTSTSHNANLPASIEAGNLLVLVVTGISGSAATCGPPSGWGEVGSLASQGNTRFHRIFTKVATGSEGAMVALTASNNVSWSTVCLLFSRTSGVIEAATPHAAATSAPNPGSLSPTGGSKKYLWLTTIGWQGAATQTADPSGFANRATSANANGSTTVSTQENETATLDPATATLSGASNAVCFNLAVHPN